jgi:(p)ppGpp synthase/HD superfamily hydrolase
LVLEDGGSEEEAIVALPHDAAEDQGGRARLGDIRRRFGSRVADPWTALTDSYEAPKPPWPVRNERYLSHLGDSPPAALRVSLADKLDNVCALIRDYERYGEELWQRSEKGRDDVRWYYGELAKQFAVFLPGPPSQEFGAAVAELGRRLDQAG